jgi:hypothetical protein
MNQPKIGAAALVLCCASALAACGSDAPEGPTTVGPPPTSATGASVVSWEQFLKYAEKNARIVNGQKVYIVEWDIPLWEHQLHDYYVSHFVETTKSTVDSLSAGGDNVWTNGKQLDLKYCISTSFGTANRARMQTEMEAATLAWMRQANVRFLYMSGEDGNCVDANANVDIPVVPFSGGGACSFFPNQDGQPFCSSAGRALIIDIADIDTWSTTPNPNDGLIYPNVGTFGTLQHELGHTLGLRHEHIREANNAIANCVSEVLNPGPFRALTPYDKNSSMHYPWCDGVLTSSQNVTDLDGQGLRSLYTQPVAWYIVEE